MLPVVFFTSQQEHDSLTDKTKKRIHGTIWSNNKSCARDAIFTKVEIYSHDGKADFGAVRPAAVSPSSLSLAATISSSLG